jgi:ketosteroid isomerase-like protein
MSQENVEIVRAAIDAYNRGDVDAALATFTDNWDSFTIGADELVDAGDDLVMPFTNVARGRDGIEVQARGVWVWTIRDGSIVQACHYQELQDALEAAGVSE